ncbi:MAG TPA: metal-dependent transcriptional regulator [Nitriliruptorales bacterium]
MAELHDTTEEYLETILELEEEGVPPLRARLVERLGLSAPTVSETVGRLETDGFLHVGDDRLIELTPKGRDLAISVVRKHRLAERLLRDVIGLAWEKIHHEACKWEHVISDEVEAKLVELLGDPGSCPHGNPIPGSKNARVHAGAVPLDQAPDGPVSVVRISEELETDDDVLVAMAAAGFIPGETGVVLSRSETGVTVSGPRGEATLPAYAAELLYVVAGQD